MQSGSQEPVVLERCMAELSRSQSIFEEHKDETGKAWTLKMSGEIKLLLVRASSGSNVPLVCFCFFRLRFHFFFFPAEQISFSFPL